MPVINGIRQGGIVDEPCASCTYRLDLDVARCGNSNMLNSGIAMPVPTFAVPPGCVYYLPISLADMVKRVIK